MESNDLRLRTNPAPLCEQECEKCSFSSLLEAAVCFQIDRAEQRSPLVDGRLRVDYIHINPVKHRLVARVRDWPYSSFHRMVKLGVYPEDWAGDVSLDGGFFGERQQVMGIAALHPSYGLRAGWVRKVNELLE
jgi:hypothetical protein